MRWPIGRVLRVRSNDVDILIRGRTTRRAIQDLYPLEWTDEPLPVLHDGLSGEAVPREDDEMPALDGPF